MERRSFLKRLGIGAATAVVAPSIFINKDNTEFINSENINNNPIEFTPKRLPTMVRHSPELLDLCTTSFSPVYAMDENGHMKIIGYTEL